MHLNTQNVELLAEAFKVNFSIKEVVFNKELENLLEEQINYLTGINNNIKFM